MPCWEVNYMSVEFKADNIDLLCAALDDLSLRYTYSPEAHVLRVAGGLTIYLNEGGKTGRVEYPEGRIDAVNRLKRAYSRQVLQQVTSKKRWFLKNKDNRSGVIRRY